MSAALKKELVEATECTPKRGEDDQKYLGRLVAAVADLEDEGWDELSPEAQAWYNDSAASLNKGKEVKGFEEEAAAPSRSSGRRGAAKKEDPADGVEYEPEVGDSVIVTTKRGKTIQGEVVEVDADILVIKDADDEEHEFDPAKIDSVTKVEEEKPNRSARGAAKKEDPADDDEIKVGDNVVAVTNRGKEITGKVIEIDGEVLIIEDADGEEEEIDTSKLKSLKVAAPADKSGRSSRQSKGVKPDAPEKAGRAPKVSKEDNGGVSVTTRIREIILDDLEADVVAVEKVLKKEKLAYKEATLKLIYSEVHRLIGMMKERKLIKGTR